MNKKKLSVVMAGAMLASSVAPVLAAETSEISADRLGMLVQEVRTQLTSKTFTKDARNKAEAGQSVYYVVVDNKRITAADIDLTEDGANARLQNALQEAFKDLKAGSKVEIFSKGYEEDEKTGNVYAYGKQTTYTETTLADSVEPIQKALAGNSKDQTNLIAQASDVAYDSGSKTLKITFKEDLAGGYTGTNKKEIVLTTASTILDFTQFKKKDGTYASVSANTSSGTKAADIYGFKVADITDFDKNYEDSLVKTIKVVGGTTAYKASDLYDGLMLTTEGHNLLATIKEADKDIKDSIANVAIAFTENGVAIGNADKHTLTERNGSYGFEVTITDRFGKTTTYTVSGAKEETQTVFNWLYSRDPKIDLLAGDNRYETAVSIAKEQASLNEAFDPAKTADIVLVNGRSLVDGLAAAPLASALSSLKASDNVLAPVLLTEADALPKATKAYIKELLYKKSQSDLDTAAKEVTVHLVGGKTVLSTAVEKELREMGLKIERYNGSNREETSVKVADKVLELQDDARTAAGVATDKVFVVGAEGEADAMSIAPVASTTGYDGVSNVGKQTPIIVSKKGGISDDVLDELDGKTVTVIGGEKAVSAEDYEAIKEAVGKTGAVRRIFGANRKATNAAIINEFYTGKFGSSTTTKKVVVAKDDVLVDALTAANLASQNNAPIVLATNSLSEEQINALELNAKTATSLYQVGIGVNPDVVKTVAQRLGLK